MKFLCDNCSTRYTIADEKVRRKVLKIRCRVCENVMTVRGPRTKPPSRIPPAISAPPNPLAPVAEPEWYAAPGNAQIGPLPFEGLTDLIEEGTIKRDTLVWNDSMDDWRPASELTALKIHFLPPPPPPPPPPAPAPDLDEQETRLFEASKDSVSTVGERSASALPAPPPPPPASSSLLSPPSPPAPVTPPEPSVPRDTTLEPPVESSSEADFSSEFGFFGEAGGTSSVDDDRPTLAEPTIPGFDDYERAVPAATRVKPQTQTRNQGPMVTVIVLLVIGVAGGAWHLMSDKAIDVDAADATLAAMTRRDAVVVKPEADAAPLREDAGVAAAPDATPRRRAKTTKKRRQSSSRSKSARANERTAASGAGVTTVADRTPATTGKSSTTKKRFGGSLAELEKGKTSVRNALLEKRKEASASDVGSAELPSALSQKRIVQVISEHKRGFNSCYDRQLKRGEAIKVGRLTLKFDIQPTGRTSNVNLGRRFEGTVLKTCIKGLVKRLRFPRFRGEAITIEYPLLFQTSF